MKKPLIELSIVLSLVGTLKYFGFGQHVVDLTMFLYNDFEACTTDMGHSSHWFKPTRGFHQECPASTGYFILIAELLGQSIRNNDNIKGIKINGLEYKSGQFADDTILFSMYDQDSLQTTIHSLVFFLKTTPGSSYIMTKVPFVELDLYVTQTQNFIPLKK